MIRINTMNDLSQLESGSKSTVPLLLLKYLGRKIFDRATLYKRSCSERGYGI